MTLGSSAASPRIDTSRPSPQMLARLDALRLNDPKRPTRWVPARLMLLNYWYLSWQEFHFGAGRMVLNGPNGSGKSTVGAVAIPVALDMDKSRDRFDPFRGRERHPAYYLLGLPDATPQSAFYHDDRTAYVVWEFQHGETNEYATIGVALRARRADGAEPPLSSWGFAVRGRRVGVDFELVSTDSRGRELAHTRPELERVIGPEHVFRRNRDYQAAVNDLLFGFESVEEYGYLMDTLLSLRAPKLDRGVRPEHLSASLRNALPALSQELMGRLSELIQRIDTAADALATTQDHVRRIRAVHEAQGSFANQTSQQGAVTVLETAIAVEQAQTKYDAQERALSKLRAQQDEVEAKHDAVQTMLAADDGALEVKQHSDAYRTLESQLATERERAAKVELEAKAMRALEDAEGAIGDAAAQGDVVRHEWHGEVGEMEALADDIEAQAGTAAWSRPAAHVRAFREALARTSVDLEPESGVDPVAALDVVLLATEGRQRVEQCRQVEQAIASRDTAQQAFDLAQHKLTMVRKQHGDADARARECDEALVVTRRDAGTALLQWIVDAPFPVDPEVGPAVEAALDQYQGPERPRQAIAPLLAAGRRADAEQEMHDQELREEESAARQERRRLAAELDHWEKARWATPTPRPGQADARAALEALGIQAVPLYAACDFAAGLTPSTQAAIETALEDAGLIDAIFISATDRQRLEAALADGTLPSDFADRWLVAPSAPSDSGRMAGRSPASSPWLVPATDDLEAAEVERLLAAIQPHLDPTDTASTAGVPAAFAADGAWRHGLLAGRAVAPEAEPRFIGEANRERQRAAAIARLTATIASVDARLLTLTETRTMVAATRRRIAAATDGLHELPVLQALQTAASELAGAMRALVRAGETLAEADVAVERARGAAKAAMLVYEQTVQVLEAARGLSLSQLRDLRAATDRVVGDARQLNGLLGRLDRLRDRAETVRAQVQQATERRDERSEDYSEARIQLEQVEGRLRAIREVLAGQDAEALRLEVETLRARVTEYRQTLGILQGKRGQIRGELTASETRGLELRETLLRREGHATAAAQAFEHLLGRYAEPAMQRALAILQARDGGAVAAAEEILKRRRADRSEFERLRSAVAERVNRVTSDLHKVFQEHRTDLAAYRPEMENHWVSFVHVGDGQRIAADTFLERLVAVEEDQRLAVSAAENDLYVNFFLGDVINAVRRKILEAQGFTQRINDILTAMHVSNGARFSLTWDPKTTVGATGIDYKKLVTFVSLDPDAVTPERRDAMLGEFRARVDAVRAAGGGRTEGSYGDRLAQEFDYRSWFEFRFYFQRPNDARIELKERGIEQLSGGERTLAQVLPLLAAVHARSLASRRQDAPKLIAMDEAFAGVDHQNMNEVIKILVDLEFSWLFSSDKLWGDSRHTSGCTTYSLRAEQGAMLPMLFLWDGQRRLSESDLPTDRSLTLGLNFDATSGSSGGETGNGTGLGTGPVLG